MAVKIRLRRMGQKKAPFYRIVVSDARSPRDGRFIDEIGTYDPTKNPTEYHVNEELAKKRSSANRNSCSYLQKRRYRKINFVRWSNERFSRSNCQITG